MVTEFGFGLERRTTHGGRTAALVEIRDDWNKKIGA
jgi:hypothetical protein